MGARIEAVATATHRGHLRGRGALHLSDAAATDCMRRSGHHAAELDLLVNVGIYKDFNAAEPALAAIIQEDIGANLGNPPALTHHGTFSFDLANGGCGVVTAAQLLDGFVGHSAKLAMIVAADVDPAPRTSRGYPFAPAGGALLLGPGGDRGFERFAIRTFPEHAEEFDASLRWDPTAGVIARGRNVIEVEELPAFAHSCLERGEQVARELCEGEVALADIDLLITSQYPVAFGTQLAQRLGIELSKVPRVPATLAGAHTAGPIAALETAFDAGQLARARHVLFVTAGAGLTIAAALYRP